MPDFNPTGASQRMLVESVDGYGEGKNAPGSCLRWCYFAIGAKPNLRAAGIAMDPWVDASPSGRHTIGAHTAVPEGFPIILGPVAAPRWAGDRKYMDGDVVISTGRGVGMQTVVVATDWPASGVIGECTLEQRARETSRPVMGYLTEWVGYNLTGGITTASDGTETVLTTTPATTTTESEEMGVTYAKVSEPSNLKGYGILAKGFLFAIDHSNRTVRHLTLPDEVATLNAAGVKWVEVPGNSIWRMVLTPGRSVHFTKFTRQDW